MGSLDAHCRLPSHLSNVSYYRRLLFSLDTTFLWFPLDTMAKTRYPPRPPSNATVGDGVPRVDSGGDRG